MLSSILRTNSCASGICYGSRSRYTFPILPKKPPGTSHHGWENNIRTQILVLWCPMWCHVGFLGAYSIGNLQFWSILTRFYAIVLFSGSDWELHPIVIPVSPCLIIQGLAEHRCNATYVITITASVVVTHYTVRVYRGYIFRQGNTHVHITFTLHKSAVGEWMPGSIWVNACKIKRSIDIDDLQWLTYTW